MTPPPTTMNATAIAAVVYAVLSTMVVAFHVAMAFGAPWGAYTMGGAHRGQLRPRLRVVALAQAAVAAIMAAIVLARAGLTLPWLCSSWLTWIVVMLGAVALVLNVVTPSAAERRLWAPVAALLLASSLVVALTAD
jgi:hypothetical protein